MNRKLYQQEFILEFCTMRFTHKNILLNEFNPNIHLELKHVKEMLTIAKQIYKKNKMKFNTCAIISQGLTITKEAREFSSTKEANQYINSSAIVTNSLQHKILGNFIIKIQKPHVPSKLFDSKEEAFKWLSNY